MKSCTKLFYVLEFLALSVMLTACVYERIVEPMDFDSYHAAWFDGRHGCDKLRCYGRRDGDGITCVIAASDGDSVLLKIQDMEGAPYRYVIRYRARNGSYQSADGPLVGSINPTYEMLDNQLEINGVTKTCTDEFHIQFPKDLESFISLSVEARVASKSGSAEAGEDSCTNDPETSFYLPVKILNGHDMKRKDRLEMPPDILCHRPNVGDVGFAYVLNEYLYVHVASTGNQKRAFIHYAGGWRLRVSYRSVDECVRDALLSERKLGDGSRVIVLNPWNADRQNEPVIASDVFDWISVKLPRDFRKLISASVELVSIDFRNLTSPMSLKDWKKMYSEHLTFLPLIII